MAYSPTFNKPYPAWHNLPSQDTPVTAGVLEAYDDALSHIEEFLDDSEAIKPVEKDANMTQPVGFDDTTGRLFTKPASGETASTTTYDNTESGLEADNVQEALDELASGAGGSTAATTTYDNTQSGLESDNVQGALDELKVIATSIQPIVKTSTMTQAVGKDNDGKLWTEPSSAMSVATDYEWVKLLDVREESSQTATSYTLSDSILNYDSIRVAAYYMYSGKYILGSTIISIEDIITGSDIAWYAINDVGEHITFTFSADGLTITKQTGSNNEYFFSVYGYKKKVYAPIIDASLVRWYDAINNTGNGHDNTATSWKDLSGNQDISSINTAIWSDDCIAPNGQYSLDTQFVYGTEPSTSISMEVYFNIGNASNSDNQILSFTSNSGMNIQLRDGSVYTYVRDSSGYMTISAPIKKFNRVHAVITFDIANKALKLYINGELIDTITVSSYVGNNLATKIASNATGSYIFTGAIYDVRIYNRVLTAEEVQQNYQYDLHRFSGLAE